MNLGRNALWVVVLLISAGVALRPGLAGNSLLVPQHPAVLKAPATDTYLDFTVNYGAQLTLIDAQGRKTGFDPSTTQTLHGIPGTSYTDDSISDATDDSPDAAESESRVLEVHPMTAGRYILKVTPTDRSSYNIEFSCIRMNGPAVDVSASGLGIASGEEHTFNLMIDPVCPESFVSGAFAASGSGLLSYGYPVAGRVHLPRAGFFRLVIVYNGRITPTTFAATLDGHTIANLFNPKTNSIEFIAIPVNSGHHITQISVSGISVLGERVRAEDSFVVDVE